MDLADTLDSLTQLCSGLVCIARGSKSEMIPWPNEPGYFEWVFTSEENELTFSVADPDGKVLQTKMDLWAGLGLFATQLRRLADDKAWTKNEDRHVWSTEFPYAELSNLESLVEEA